MPPTKTKKGFTTNKKYQGKYIAMPSFRDKTVVASGKNPEDVILRAHEKGFSRPVLMFLPANNTVHIY